MACRRSPASCPEGPSKLLVYLQPREATSAGEDDDADEPNIFVSSGEIDRFATPRRSKRARR